MAGERGKRVTVRSGQLSIGTAAVLIGVGNAGGSTIYIHQEPNSPHDIYLGGETVTTATGFQLHKGVHQTINLPEGVRLYAVASTTEVLYVLQTGGR